MELKSLITGLGLLVCLAIVASSMGYSARDMEIDYNRAISKDSMEIEVNTLYERVVEPPNLNKISIPDKVLYTSGQPAAYGLAAFIKEEGIDLVVRLNFDDASTDVLHWMNEESYCHEVGAHFEMFNILKYQVDDIRWQTLMDEVAERISLHDRVLVHCSTGEYHARSAVGFYLAGLNFPFDEIINMINWKELDPESVNYKRYKYGFYQNSSQYAL
ncbi:MAG: hypothetical protein AAFR59_04250 [Bacteroidota bacterium]